jgi:ParB-like chromosome segregation protein Spo0J
LTVTNGSGIRELAYLKECCEQVQASTVAMVPINSVVVSGTPRSGGEDAQHVRALAEVQADLPPIVVHRRTMQVIDGLHRLRAAMLHGRTEIPVRYFDGGTEDAYLLSIAMNVTHGLPLSSADRVAAVERIFAVYPSWSDRAIAAAVGLSPRKVSEVRKSLAGQIAAQEHRVGRDGKVRPINGASGRERAGELIKEKPHASLRAIARQAGVSPATAADVRDRMRRGAQPVLQPRDQARREDRHLSKVDMRAGSAAPPTPDELFAVLRNLQNDPSLRFNEVGRLVLRMLQTCALAATERDRILETVPPHCTNQVSDLLLGYANVWRSFAIELRNKSAVA